MISSYRLILVIVLLLIAVNAQAFNLQPFQARYHVYRGNTYVANSDFSLQPEKSEWVWKMKAKPRGIYSWLTRKKPFAETRMQKNQQQIQLLLERTGDYPDKPAKKNTWFDHQNKIIYSMNKQKISKLNLPHDIYNYHSVHLLYPQMLENNETRHTIHFYKSGKVLESTLVLEKQVELDSKKDKMVVDKVTQSFKKSKKKLIYYYQGNTLAPLKIEQINPGKDSSIMWRVSIK